MDDLKKESLITRSRKSASLLVRVVLGVSIFLAAGELGRCLGCYDTDKTRAKHEEKYIPNRTYDSMPSPDSPLYTADSKGNRR